MTDYLPLPGTPVEELDTPCIVVDLDAAESNIAKLQAAANEMGVDVRPHSKTNKSPYWVRKQLAAGAIGVCCAKVGEAEVMVEAGVPEVMIPNQVIGKRKIARLIALARSASMIVAVEDSGNVDDLSEASSAAGTELGVIVEINVGMDRCGVDGDGAVDLAKQIDAAPGLRFDGLMGYEGHTVAERDYETRKIKAEKAMAILTGAADQIRAEGIEVKLVSAAGTGTYNITGQVDGVTELQCGSYIFMDGDYLEVFNDFEPALSVMATVISRQQEDVAVADFGLKSISVDRGIAEVISPANAEIMAHSEEHTKIALKDAGSKALKVGDKVSVRPKHGDTTINLHEYYFGVRNGKLEQAIPIPGRGKFR
ncbi:DSD1 family PLP-dependent enzyme [Candidatus Lucifugimonas marina]|uniref:DSD1 family PLP-dependent enzyme n=1 Tax=Candidatus Lucifugimonas marina TaxID=3038979 RepID=A0AAJ6CQY4_9CHLR|nr:DSD1 family PLP-dependent enzyme [SAR202 cluster bacterium JH702]MDG0870712.1 DSD1 family PLP-dependent enzyme [SAR202 cluster bacterium JH639]WFG34796.1 DSD1 family PLP-dependent enzyme [SAR202 cluster bacterium JH545]WFG38736.1 DSD1 family PLP-dependent enzyme [SAR202 cluster bacterium JH1073]